MICELRMSKAEVLEKFGDVRLQIIYMRGNVSRYFVEHQRLFFASSIENFQDDSVTVRQVIESGENLTVSRENGYVFIQTRES